MNQKHGLCHTRLYKIWCKMKERCYNEHSIKYDNYGGRGIKVCDEWRYDFAKFYDWAIQNGYDDILTLDRIDVNKNYCPYNCRWATQKQQQNNRRDNLYITVNGKKYTVSEYAQMKNLSPVSIAWRIHHGWKENDIIDKPFERTKERLLTFNGKSQSINAWARELGINKVTIRNRLNRYGWSVEETLTIKPRLKNG